MKEFAAGATGNGFAVLHVSSRIIISRIVYGARFGFAMKPFGKDFSPLPGFLPKVPEDHESR